MPDRPIFDSRKLRAEIVDAWGEHGAHTEAFDHILSEIDRLQLLLIEATNPGIDMEKVKATRTKRQADLEGEL
jgi:hypothetical protein